MIYIILMILNLFCREELKMKLLLNSEKKIEKTIIGNVENIKSLEPITISSPSIIGADKKLILKIHEKGNSQEQRIIIELLYDSKTLINQFKVGRDYLFAISDDYCVGFLEVINNKVELPNGKLVNLEDYKKQIMNKAFPDYWGIKVK